MPKFGLAMLASLAMVTIEQLMLSLTEYSNPGQLVWPYLVIAGSDDRTVRWIFGFAQFSILYLPLCYCNWYWQDEKLLVEKVKGQTENSGSHFSLTFAQENWIFWLANISHSIFGLHYFPHIYHFVCAVIILFSVVQKKKPLC